MLEKEKLELEMQLGQIPQKSTKPKRLKPKRQTWQTTNLTTEILSPNQVL
jgi:hypothetical protein